MARRTDDKYTPWRELIFGVIGIGSFWGGVSMASGADSIPEFVAAGTCFVVTALCFVVCYWLWIIGRHRSKQRRIFWGIITAVAFAVELSITIPWTHYRWKLKAPPDVTVCLVNYQHPVLVILNPSDRPVERAQFIPGIFNLDAPTPDEPLLVPGRIFDLISPHATSGAYDIFSEINGSPAIKVGDRIVGSVGISCPLCATGHSFFVYLTWGKNDGWFAQIKGQTTGNVYTPMDMSDSSKPHLSAAGVALQVLRVPDNERIPIRSLNQLIGKNNTIDLFKCVSK